MADASPSGKEPVDLVQTYTEALALFLRSGSEQILYRASLFSRGCIERGLGPEEIVALHAETFPRAMAGLPLREQVAASASSLQFLLEVMIAYGVQYKEFLDLKQAEVARAETVRADLLMRVAHELRTPITAATGNLDLAERSLERGNLERVPRLLGQSRLALRRLARLTADLLDASREEIPLLERTLLDVVPLLAEACAWAEAAAEEKGIAIALHAEAPVEAFGNADALLSIVGNLLSNAVRYTPSGGQVTVRASREADRSCIEVSDTGIGMSPEVMDQIFKKFYRSPEAHATEPMGLGLGLALVQQLVRAHGGTVEVESTPGSGSTFRVWLPSSTRAERGGADG